MLRERRRHTNFKPNRKLDRKSSRGMIYENEELRLRTININAEVERGQSDIKKLIRENYRLRSENWTLRDEYDRLDKLLKSKNRPNGHPNKDSHEYRGDFKHGYDYDDPYRCYNCLGDEDGISCDMCNENERYTKELDDRKPSTSTNGDQMNGYDEFKSNKCGPALMPSSTRNDKINMNFDHLSVVSEECLSNSEDQTNANNNKSDNELSEITQDPVYENFQSTIPPLKHFENLSYKDIGPNIDAMGEIHFDGEMYQVNEPTPPPPSPPPTVQAMNRRSTSLPLPPPPILSEEGNIIQDESLENESNAEDKPPKYFFAPLKTKRKSSVCSEMRPDVFVSNIVPSDGNRVATIRKPHNPLKYPSNLNAASIDPEAPSQLEAKDIQGLSKGVENIQMQPNQLYENVPSTDSDQTPPFRTEMSLVLSYSGNKSKYSTTQNSNKTQDSDTDTPPPNIPLAMKLLPNKLTYAGKPEYKQISGRSEEAEQSIVNVENSANEEILSKSQVNSMHDSTDSNGKTSKIKENALKNGEKLEFGSNGDNAGASGSKEKETNSKSKKRNSNDSQESKETGGSSKNSHENNGKDQNARRVSIHFNGKPMNDHQETEPHSNDSDVNNTTNNNTTENMTEEEILAIPPISYLRSRRTSCSRKMHDEMGAFLYPPNPFGFGGYKRGRRPSFLSRRHSDGLLATRPTQYHLDYGLIPKTSSRCQCHRGHNNHLGVDAYCGDFCNNMPMNSGMTLGGSTGSSIGNNMTSSRESLGNTSQQSTSRRKISITSHSKSGKIPWCACWGNGCI